MIRIKDKKAFEMAIGTIVMIVLFVTMLILGIVLIRNIMCAGVGLTSNINTKVEGEINSLFQTTGGEVVCLGQESDPVIMNTGRLNIVSCAINAREEGKQYAFTVSSMKMTTGSATSDVPDAWIIGEKNWGPQTVGTTDNLPKKILQINIPDTASEGYININVVATKDGSSVYTQTLTFSIKKAGFLKTSMC